MVGRYSSYRKKRKVSRKRKGLRADRSDVGRNAALRAMGVFAPLSRYQRAKRFLSRNRWKIAGAVGAGALGYLGYRNRAGIGRVLVNPTTAGLSAGLSARMPNVRSRLPNVSLPSMPVYFEDYMPSGLSGYAIPRGAGSAYSDAIARGDSHLVAGYPLAGYSRPVARYAPIGDRMTRRRPASIHIE